MLRTLVAGLALTATPHEAQAFVLDLGGGGLAALAGLPHVAGVGTRTEPDVVRRVLAEVRGVLDRREASFRARGIDSVEAGGARPAAPPATGGRAREPDDGYGDVFLVVDGWGALRAELDEVEVELQRLAGRGLALGVHLVAATSRWADFRTATRDLFGTRLELRLGDPADSEIDRRAAARVPAGRPGRGLVTGGGTCSPPSPASTASPCPARSPPGWTTSSDGSRPPGRGQPRHACACSRPGGPDRGPGGPRTRGG